jgi:hypothetical protein
MGGRRPSSQLSHGASFRNRSATGCRAVVWGVLLAAWQGYEIAVGESDPAYVVATVFSVCAVVLSLTARAQAPSPEPASGRQ